MRVLVSTENISSASRVRPWQWFNVLSLDAPLVAIAWQLWFAQCVGIVLAPITVATLGVTVWMIYAADRLLDVHGPRRAAAVTDRHLFHRKHARALSSAVLISFAVLILTANRLNEDVLRNGLVLTGLVALYFAGVHLLPKSFSNLCPKELAVGAVFAVGTALAPCSRLHRAGPLALPVVLLALLCFLNCAAIESWEWKSRLADCARPHSLTIWFSAHLRFISAVVASVAGLALVVGSQHSCVFAPLLLSALGFLWLDLERDHLTISFFRVLADVPLLTPLLALGLYHG